MLQQGRSWSGRERNVCFLNTRGGRFADISAASGFDFPDDARAIALCDWDQDGRVDLWVSNRNAPRLRFLRNDSGSPGRYLALRLAGDGRRTSRDAIGARVEVRPAGAEERPLVKTLRAGEGFLSQSSKWLSFGLGESESIASVTVRWPGGETQVLAGLEPNRRYLIRQGSPAALEAPPRSASRLEPGESELPAASERARIPLVMLLRMPEISYRDFAGAPRALRPGKGKHVLLNLWASWCAPCVGELEELARRKEEIEAAGVEVLALSTDGLGEDGSQPARARELLEKLRFPFAAGQAGDRLVRLLQRLHDAHIPLHRPLPLPASFLIDREGRLAVIYKGPLTAGELLADLDHSSGTRAERLRRAAASAGSTIDHPAVEEAALTAEAMNRFQLALDLAGRGRLEDAAPHYGDLLEIKPGLAEAHFQLGTVLERLGDLAGAEARYRRALELHPATREANNTLGLLLARLGRMQEAAASFRREIALHPQLAPAHNHLGLVYLERGELAEAEACFRAALERDPELADARNNLGLALRRQGKLEEAAAEYREAVRLKPDFAEAHNNLGSLLLRQGEAAAAAAHFQRALESRPDLGAARENLERARALLEVPGR
jgi:Tfp pilus assembly protein PilF/peroxiredoxin